MNDVIMASVAALKSQSDKAQFSLYTGFRSVRRSSDPVRFEGIVEKPVSVTLDRQTKAFFERHSDDPRQLMREVLENHAKRHALSTPE